MWSWTGQWRATVENYRSGLRDTKSSGKNALVPSRLHREMPSEAINPVLKQDDSRGISAARSSRRDGPFASRFLQSLDRLQTHQQTPVEGQP